MTQEVFDKQIHELQQLLKKLQRADRKLRRGHQQLRREFDEHYEDYHPQEEREGRGDPD